MKEKIIMDTGYKDDTIERDKVLICIQDVRTFNWWYNWDEYNSWMCKNKLKKKKKKEEKEHFFIWIPLFLNSSVKIKLINSWLTYEWTIDRSLKLRGYNIK